MTGIVLLLLTAKLKQYLGQVRRSPRKLVSLLSVYLVWLSVIGMVAFMLRLTGILSGSGPRGFLGILSEVTMTTILAVGAFLGIKGGVTAFPYELDYVLTSGVKPRTFLLSDLLFQLCLLSLFIVPPAALMLVMLTYPAHLAYLGRAVPLYLLAILISIMLSHVLGVSRAALGERRARMLGWSLLLLILTPLALLALRISPPYPLTLHPAIVLASAIEGVRESLYLTAPYAAVLALAYLRLSKSNFYSSVSPLLFSVLMEPPGKLSRYIRLPVGLDRFLGLRGAGGYLSLMYRVHLTRVLREGSLWTGMIVLLFLTLANTAVPRLIGATQFPEVAELTLITLYTPLLPALLSINWSLSERPNIWVINTSPQGERQYLSGLYLAYLTVTIPFAMLLYGLVSIGSRETPFLLIDLVLLFSMSSFGSALSILISLIARTAPSPLSLSSLLYVLIPLAGSLLLSLPILMIRLYEPLASSPTLGLMANLVAYTSISAAAIYRIITVGGVKYLR